MDVNDGEEEVSVPSLILNSIDSQQKEVLSPEDLAWADSCLIEDADILESTWIPLKNALLDIITSTPETFSTNFVGGADTEILPPIEENKNAAGFQGNGDDFSSVTKAAQRMTDSIQDHNMADTQASSSSFEENIMPVSEGNVQAASNHVNMEHSSASSSTYNTLQIHVATANIDDDLNNEKSEALPSPVFQGNPFLPTYSEDLKENAAVVDSGLNLDFLVHDSEQPSDDIFKIWDLNVPNEEEDEFGKQLNKALATNSFQMTPSSFDYSEQWKVLEEGSPGNLVSSNNSEQLNALEQVPLDNLIEGFADLSLK